MTDKILDGDNFEIQRTKINQQVDEKGQLTAIGGRLKVAQGWSQQRLVEATGVAMNGTTLEYNDDGNLLIVTAIAGNFIYDIEQKSTGETDARLIVVRFETTGFITPRFGNLVMPANYGSEGSGAAIINIVPGLELVFVEIYISPGVSQFHFIGTNIPEKFAQGSSTYSVGDAGSPWNIIISYDYNIHHVTITADDKTFTGFGNPTTGGEAYTNRGTVHFIVLDEASKSLTVINSSTLQLPEGRDFILQPGDVASFLQINESTDTFVLLGKSSTQLPPTKSVVIQDGDLRTVSDATYEPFFAGNATIKYNYESSYIAGPTQIKIPDGVTKARFGVLVYAPSTTQLEPHVYGFRLLKNYAKFTPENVGTLGETVIVGNPSGNYLSRAVTWLNQTIFSVGPVTYLHFKIDSVVGNLAAAGDLKIYGYDETKLGSYYNPIVTANDTITIANADIVPGIFSFNAPIVGAIDEGEYASYLFDFENDPGVGNYVRLVAANAEELGAIFPTESGTANGFFLGNQHPNISTLRSIRDNINGPVSVDNDWNQTLDGEDSDYPIWIAIQEFNSTQNVILSEATFGDGQVDPDHNLLMTTPTIPVSEGDTYSLDSYFGGEPDGDPPKNQIKEFWMEIIE